MNATATAHPNIALVKYWGKRDLSLNLPAVPSLSITLDTFRTRTAVTWGIDGPQDEVSLDGAEVSGPAAARVGRFLDLVAEWPGLTPASRPRCRVVSDNNFPTAAGLASSSSAFAALALAATAAAGRSRSAGQLSVLARRGSGSACRSIWGGWVEWRTGTRADGADSHGQPLAGPNHWDLRLVVATLEGGPKAVGSTAGMERSRATSPYYEAWVAGGAGHMDRARQAVLDRDLEALGTEMEQSTVEMHATMLTARPTIRYWMPPTLAAMKVVEELRAQGVGAWYTMDAGPNVKVLCSAADAAAVASALGEAAADVRILGIGGDARLE